MTFAVLEKSRLHRAVGPGVLCDTRTEYGTRIGRYLKRSFSRSAVLASILRPTDSTRAACLLSRLPDVFLRGLEDLFQTRRASRDFSRCFCDGPRGSRSMAAFYRVGLILMNNSTEHRG